MILKILALIVIVALTASFYKKLPIRFKLLASIMMFLSSLNIYKFAMVQPRKDLLFLNIAIFIYGLIRFFQKNEKI